MILLLRTKKYIYIECLESYKKAIKVINNWFTLVADKKDIKTLMYVSKL